MHGLTSLKRGSLFCGNEGPTPEFLYLHYYVWNKVAPNLKRKSLHNRWRR